MKLKQACIELTLGNARSSIPGSCCSSELTEWQECQMSLGKRCGRKRKLFFRCGFYLSIRPDGSVRGTKDKNCPYATMEMFSVGAGFVKIAGVETDLFLTIDDTGILRGTDVDCEECIFEEIVVRDFFSVFKSYAYSNERWMVGVTNQGLSHCITCIGPLEKHRELHSLTQVVPSKS